MSRPFNAKRYARLLEGLEASEAQYSKLERTKRIDSEFFNPKCLNTVAALERIKAVPLASTVGVSDGNHFSISDEFVDDGVPYFRGQDVTGSFFMEQASPVMIPPHIFAQRHMTRSHLAKGDVLLSIVGTIGESALFSSTQPATCSCKLAILRPRSISAEYLAVFLKSEHGRLQVLRQTRGAIQGSLLLEDMDQILVPRFSKDFELRIVKMVCSAQATFENAKTQQTQAEQTLLRSLGLEGWEPPEPLTYTRRASEAHAAGRMDSDYFAPARYATLEKLAAMPHRLLSDCCDSIRDLFDPTAPQGITEARNFDVGEALKPALDDSLTPVPVEEIGSTKKIMKRGDVVISRLRSYLRQIAVVNTSDSVLTVGSSEFIVLRPRSGISPELLLVFLRSQPVQTILKYCQEGNQHPRFGESNLLEIPFPDVLQKHSESIITQIRQAHNARHEAQSLLAKAKHSVEVAIEEGEAKALKAIA